MHSMQAESVDMLSPFYSFSLLLHMWYTFTPEFLSIKIIKSLSLCTYYLIGQISTSLRKKVYRLHQIKTQLIKRVI